MGDGLCFESRALRERSPHCGAGLFVHRFAFAGLKFLGVRRGSVNQKQRARTPVLHSICRGEREHERGTGNEFVSWRAGKPATFLSGEAAAKGSLGVAGRSPRDLFPKRHALKVRLPLKFIARVIVR